MARKPPARRISQGDIARIRARMSELGSEIRGLRVAMASYQSEIRRVLIRLGDAEEWSTGGETA